MPSLQSFWYILKDYTLKFIILESCSPYMTLCEKLSSVVRQQLKMLDYFSSTHLQLLQCSNFPVSLDHSFYVSNQSRNDLLSTLISGRNGNSTKNTTVKILLNLKKESCSNETCSKKNPRTMTSLTIKNRVLDDDYKQITATSGCIIFSH